MTSEEIVNIINNSTIKTVTDFSYKMENLFPGTRGLEVINKKDLSNAGILCTARFYNGKDTIILKGFLYPNDNWHEETHGYITAKVV